MRKRTGRAGSNALLERIAESALSSGAVDPSGKPASQVRVEINRYVESFLKQFDDGRIGIAVTVEHHRNLLKAARRFGRDGERELACLLYATWFEHWMNGAISALAPRRWHLTEAELSEMMRDVPIRGKLSWFAKVIGLGSINKEHTKRIMQICEARNAFVHYKYRPLIFNRDRLHHDPRPRIPSLTEAEKSVHYLTALVRRKVGRGSRFLARGVVRSRTQSDA